MDILADTYFFQGCEEELNSLRVMAREVGGVLGSLTHFPCHFSYLLSSSHLTLFLLSLLVPDFRVCLYFLLPKHPSYSDMTQVSVKESSSFSSPWDSPNSALLLHAFFFNPPFWFFLVSFLSTCRCSWPPWTAIGISMAPFYDLIISGRRTPDAPLPTPLGALKRPN